MALQRGRLQVDGETQTIGFARERSHARRLADMRIRSQMAFARIALMIIRSICRFEEYERVRICASVRSRRIGHGLHRSDRQLLWASHRWSFPRIPCDLLREFTLVEKHERQRKQKMGLARDTARAGSGRPGGSGNCAGKLRPPRVWRGHLAHVAYDGDHLVFRFCNCCMVARACLQLRRMAAQAS